VGKDYGGQPLRCVPHPLNRVELHRLTGAPKRFLSNGNSYGPEEWVCHSRAPTTPTETLPCPPQFHIGLPHEHTLPIHLFKFASVSQSLSQRYAKSAYSRIYVYITAYSHVRWVFFFGRAAYTHTHIHIHIHTYTCTYIHDTHAYAYMHIFPCVHTHNIYIYIYTHIHAYIHT
jgi:hypothetical protein